MAGEDLLAVMRREGVGDLFDLSKRTIDGGNCFLCGIHLDKTNRSREDFVPIWLSKMSGGPDHLRGITLPNFTKFTGRKMLVPSCKHCNNELLGQIEKTVSSAFKAGPDAVRALDPKALRIWLTKIAYGAQLFSHRLPSQRSDPGSVPITTDAEMRSYTLLHVRLQEARGLVEFDGASGSTWIFDAFETGCATCDSDLALIKGWPWPVMIRLGKTVLISFLGEYGTLQRELDSSQFVAAASAQKLNSIQVRATFAWFIYRASLLSQRSFTERYSAKAGKFWFSAVHNGKEALGPIDPKLQTAIFARLIDKTDEEVAAEGGVERWLHDEVGRPHDGQLPPGAGATRSL